MAELKVESAGILIRAVIEVLVAVWLSIIGALETGSAMAVCGIKTPAADELEPTLFVMVTTQLKKALAILLMSAMVIVW